MTKDFPLCAHHILLFLHHIPDDKSSPLMIVMLPSELFYFNVFHCNQVQLQQYKILVKVNISPQVRTTNIDAKNGVDLLIAPAL